MVLLFTMPLNHKLLSRMVMALFVRASKLVVSLLTEHSFGD